MSSDAFAKIGALGKKAMKGANDLRSKVNSLDSMGKSSSSSSSSSSRPTPPPPPRPSASSASRDPSSIPSTTSSYEAQPPPPPARATAFTPPAPPARPSSTSSSSSAAPPAPPSLPKRTGPPPPSLPPRKHSEEPPPAGLETSTPPLPVRPPLPARTSTAGSTPSIHSRKADPPTTATEQPKPAPRWPPVNALPAYSRGPSSSTPASTFPESQAMAPPSASGQIRTASPSRPSPSLPVKPARPTIPTPLPRSTEVEPAESVSRDAAGNGDDELGSVAERMKAMRMKLNGGPLTTAPKPSLPPKPAPKPKPMAINSQPIPVPSPQPPAEPHSDDFGHQEDVHAREQPAPPSIPAFSRPSIPSHTRPSSHIAASIHTPPQAAFDPPIPSHAEPAPAPQTSYASGTTSQPAPPNFRMLIPPPLARDIELDFHTGWFTNLGSLPPILDPIHQRQGLLMTCNSSARGPSASQLTRTVFIAIRYLYDLSTTLLRITYEERDPMNTVYGEQKHLSPPSPYAQSELIEASSWFGSQVLEWCQGQMGNQVGNGECWTLAFEATKAVEGCQESMGKVHGHPVYEVRRGDGIFMDDDEEERGLGGWEGEIVGEDEIRPGDIMQMVTCRFESRDPSSGRLLSYSTAGAPDHTAVVSSVGTGSDGRSMRLEVLQQNVGGVRNVMEGHFDLGEMVRGGVRIYRPVWTEWLGVLKPDWDQ